MITRTLLTGLLAGLAAGLVLSALYFWKTQPLILAAEVFEHGGAAGDAADLFARTGKTVLFNILTGAAFGLLLSAALTLRGRAVGARQGILWGIAGFATFALAPSFGLPPELPGSYAAPLEARQAWWILTAAATAGGLGLMVFARAWGLRIAGAVLLLVPHIVGAPHPDAPGGAVPPELAAQFVTASLASSALFWVVLGGCAGYLYDRSGRGGPA